MKKETAKHEKYLLQIEDLRRRLDEAEDALRAIRNGEVDALVISTPEGDQIFALKSADYSYRIFVEVMHEGAVTLDPGGAILYCNLRFSEMLQVPLEKLIGASLGQFVDPGHREIFEAAFQRRQQEDGKAEIFLKRSDGASVPVLISFNQMKYVDGIFTCAVVTDLTERKLAEEQMRSLAVQLLEAQEKERKRIALEIHDILGSSLASIQYKLEDLVINIPHAAPSTLAASIKTLINLTKEIMGEVRRLQSNLRPPTLDDLGLLATLNWFFRQFQSIYTNIGLESRFEIREEEIPDPLKVILFRVAQEALNNIAKHARADRVQLTLKKTGARVELAIKDNGKGFDPEDGGRPKPPGRGIGLSSMKERIEVSGGQFQIKSAPGKGTLIKAGWPV